jgi:hypothetical protein
MGYYDNYLVDNHSCIIVGVQATGARLSEESRAAEDMIARFAQWQQKSPQSIAADASYGNGALLQWLMDRQITPYMPTRDAVARTRSPLFGPERFTYQPESNSYLCRCAAFYGKTPNRPCDTVLESNYIVIPLPDRILARYNCENASNGDCVFDACLTQGVHPALPGLKIETWGS